MLYIGNFSFSDLNEESDNYCLMPAIVEATDADTALERFSEMLQKMHGQSSLLAGAKDIYLDSLIELNETPDEAILLQWQKVIAGEDGLYSVLSALPDEKEIPGAYSWSEVDQWDEPYDPNEDEAYDDDDEISPEELADAITTALDLLISDEADDAEDEDFADYEAAFLSFDYEE